MNPVQQRLAALEGAGWTLAAIADEVDVSYNTVQKWKAGDRQPLHSKALVIVLDRLLERRRIPSRRRAKR